MKNREYSRFLYWLVPACMFFLAETVTGNLRSITPLSVALNLLLYGLLYLGVFILTGTTKYGWPILNLLLCALAAGEYFVISFRERPIMIWDVLALRTAMTVSTNYRFVITPRLVLTFLAAALMGAIVFFRPLAWGKGLLRRTTAGTAWLAGCLVYGGALFGWLAPTFGLDVPMWDPIVSFEKEGYLLSTLLSFRSVIPPKPSGYSEEEAVQLAGAQSDGDPEKIRPINVICIMNESFSDLRLYNGLNGDRSFETDQTFLDFFDSLTENVQKGNLYVPVFGAMTANSEYEFLTGNSCAYVPQGSIPFQFYTKAGDDSLARRFQAEGYRTVAMHPYPGYNWNRTVAYENLGFDTFLDGGYYDGLEEEMEWERPRGYMSDRSDYDGILRQLREKEPGEKLFLFNVTMQNHGGYEVKGLEATVHVTRVNGAECTGEYPKADQYLTLMRMSDEALSYLLGELEKFGEPTMVVLFGDHQPSVETPFFENLYGMRWSEVPDHLKINSFRTPYLIWTNYDRKISETGDMSAFMLGGQVLKEAGMDADGLFAVSQELGERYSAVHAMGVLEKDGTFSGSREGISSDSFPDIRRFHVLQYYEIFGE